MPDSKSQSHSALVGQYGEMIVAQWLQQQGWSILARGWTSRWGELDIVAKHDKSGLAFVEVKTRTRGNWDEDGLYAITRSKQTKLWKTAQLFLAQYSQFAEPPCRFDVALVNVRKVRSQTPSTFNPNTPITINQPVMLDGYELTLHTYLDAAFELN
jgi:putative endonuclease